LCISGNHVYFIRLTSLTLRDSLLLDPKDVDPNVHPTKREVHFLNEEAIIECVSDHLQSALVKHSTSRSFETQASWKPVKAIRTLTMTQTLLTGGILDHSSSKRPNKRRKLDDENEEEVVPAGQFRSPHLWIC
jgi:DNA mismatch repair protein MLH1